MSATTNKVKVVLDRLRSALGTGENPDGSNHNFITEWYNDNVAKIGNGPWCEMTNTWSCWTSGAKLLKVGRAYTVWATDDAFKNTNGSSWHFGTKGMRAGDHVYYDWSGRKGNRSLVDHTGTVEKILEDGTFYVLEGNTTGNKLRRMRRDGKYVVGYVRLDWDRIPDPTPSKPNEPAKPRKPDTAKVKVIQKLLKVTVDGDWGPYTDSRAQLMHKASWAHVGSPKHVPSKFDIRDVQLVIGTTRDGVWGFRSQASLALWVREMQSALGVPRDGEWGPITDNAYLVVRKQNLNNY